MTRPVSGMLWGFLPVDHYIYWFYPKGIKMFDVEMFKDTSAVRVQYQWTTEILWKNFYSICIQIFSLFLRNINEKDELYDQILWTTYMHQNNNEHF